MDLAGTMKYSVEVSYDVKRVFNGPGVIPKVLLSQKRVTNQEEHFKTLIFRPFLGPTW